MSTATIALRTRPRPPLGPALGRSRLSVGTLVLSVVLHAVVLGALVLSAALRYEPPAKTYIVNLVPAIAAVGRPQGRPTAPVVPPRPSEVAPPPTPAKTTPTELPQREARVAKTAPAELPQRETRAPKAPLEMPARTSVRESMSLPDRSLPTRPAAVPRPGDKELPAAALPRGPSEPAPKREVAVPSPAPSPAPSPVPSPSPPPPPLGQATGSVQGVGAVTLNVSDFPYAWYIQAIHRKIQERWEGRAMDGRQPEVIFEIGGDGKLRRLSIGKSSGNPAYDQLALRAVGDANPFPPLPSGFGKPSLTVGLQFIYDPRVR